VARHVNFLGDEGAERVRAAYPGATWDRLAEIKRRYDPENVFRLNQNVPPGGAAHAPPRRLSAACKTGVEMASRTTAPLRVGQVFEVRFPRFTPRITLQSPRELTVEIVEGDNVGFSDTVEYEAVAVREGLVVLSWREHIGSTIVHVLDLVSGDAYTAVTSAEGDFMRLAGRIDVEPQPD
jgi:hypothetical protein